MQVFKRFPGTGTRVGLFILFLCGGLGLAALVGVLSGGMDWRGRLLIICCATLAYCLLFIDRKSLHRMKITSKDLPREWKDFLKEHSLFYPRLNRLKRRRFERDIKLILAEHPVRTPDWCEVDFEKRLLIAAGFATVLMGRPYWELPLPKTIVLVPGGNLDANLKPGNGKYAAAATPDTLYLTEKHLDVSFSDGMDGYNNIYHEIAHYFDMEDGMGDGRPFFSHRLRLLEREHIVCDLWKRIIHYELEQVRKGELSFRPHAAKNAGELFACSVELFFERPGELKRISFDLYFMLSKFFNIDPIKILARNR